MGGETRPPIFLTGVYMAITSKTDIGNMALDLLSAGNVQDIENPTNPTAELLARWYDQARRNVLRSHPWNCASKRVVLAASSTDPEFGYTAAFPVPADFIRLKYICDSDGNIIQASEYTPEDNRILYNGDSGVLNLVYVYDLTDVSRMDSMLIDLIALELALCIAFKVTEGQTNVERVGQLYKQRAALARAIDGQESPPRKITRSKALGARRNRSTNRTDIVTW